MFLQGTQALFFMAKTNAIISSGTIPGGTAVFWYSCMRAFNCRTISGCLRLKSCRSVGSADMLKRANSTMFVFWSWERKRETRSQKHVKDLCWQISPFQLKQQVVQSDVQSTLNNKKMIPLFCYNVPVFAVLYKLNRSVFIADGFIFILLVSF